MKLREWEIGKLLVAGWQTASDERVTAGFISKYISRRKTCRALPQRQQVQRRKTAAHAQRFQRNVQGTPAREQTAVQEGKGQCELMGPGGARRHASAASRSAHGSCSSSSGSKSSQSALLRHMEGDAGVRAAAKPAAPRSMEWHWRPLLGAHAVASGGRTGVALR